MKRIIIVFAVVLSTSLYTGNSLRAENETASSFAFSGLTSDLPARRFSLAGAAFGRSLGIANDVAVNPSAMSFSLSNLGAYAQYGNWMPSCCSDKHLAIGTGFSASRFSFGLNGSYSLGSKYELITSNGSSEGYFSPSDLLVRAAAAYRIAEHFSIGLNAGYANSRLSESVSKQSISFGVFASYSSNAVSASVGAKNLGPKVDGVYYLPSSMNVGISYSLLKGDKHDLSLDAAVEYYFLSENKSTAFSLGSEYGIFDFAFIRAGYRYAGDKAPLPSFASAGLGLKLFGASLEGSYIFASPTLDGTMMFSLGFEF